MTSTFFSRLATAGQALLLALTFSTYTLAEPTTPASASANTSASYTPVAPTNEAVLPGTEQLSEKQLAFQAGLVALGENPSDEQIQALATEQGLDPETVERLLAMKADLAAALDEEQTGHDLSPWGMYQAADVVVKAVMIGLVIASIITWTIWIAKTIEIARARRRLKRDLQDLKGARNLKQAANQVQANSLGKLLADDAQNELDLSQHSRDKEAIKERVSFRLERLVAACGRNMSQGTGVLATIGSTAPFVGLFGTVWGIMNSFIGIAKSQTTNLAVVAPGIAEALLATGLGLVAAIPAVIIYNVFARSIAGYKAQVADASAEILLLVSRDMDHQPPADQTNVAPVAKVG